MEPYFKTTAIDLSYQHHEDGYGLIFIHGNDAEKFLQGQLTSDIRQITPTRYGLSAYCNLKGRVRALLTIFLHDKGYYLLCPHRILSNTLSTLKKYARFSKVELNDVSSKWDVMGIHIQPINPHTTKEILCNHLLEQNHFKDIFVSPEKKELFSAPQLSCPQPDLQVLALPDPYVKFLILGSVHAIEELRKRLNAYIVASTDVKEECNQHHFYDKGTFEDWKLLSIKAGIPEIYPETVEKFLPHSLNLPALKAVSFDKGCYCGQEVIARMQYRATLKKHMYRATLEKDLMLPLPGAPLIASDSEEEAGTLIMVSRSASKIEMLIEAQDVYTNAPNSLFLVQEGKKIPLVIEEKFIL